MAAFYSPYAAVWINDEILLVSERFKNVLRVVTFKCKFGHIISAHHISDFD